MRWWNILEQLLLKIITFTVGETEYVWGGQSDKQPVHSRSVSTAFILCVCLCLIPVLENGNVLKSSRVKTIVVFKEISW